METPDDKRPEPGTSLPSFDERSSAGKALRRTVPRSGHDEWKLAKRRDLIGLLDASNAGRVPELVPIRYGRMLASPLAFLRGAAGIMAFDLAKTPATGLKVQASGDCHLMNFGEYGTPERNLAFDLTDFDETLPAAWEWDVKRLAASVMVAGRYRNVPDYNCREAVYAVLASYRTRMAEFARMSPLQRWYARIDSQDMLALSRAPGARRKRAKEFAEARERTGEALLKKTTEVIDGRRVIRDDPPLISHAGEADAFEAEMRHFFRCYRHSLADDRKALIDRYELVDVAVKVVGVGSVGTRCAVSLWMADGCEPLFLQFKEARPSVLEPYHGKSRYANRGQRVVEGQKLMQASSDIFLGWAAIEETDTHYYVRQLRDMKNSIDIDAIDLPELTDYAGFCGWALARAHAKSGDPAAIAGYLGKSNVFDIAAADFARDYADQTEADHAALKKAVAAGVVQAVKE